MDGVEKVLCKGRTRGDAATKPIVTKLEKREDGSLFIRIDDRLNLAAWIEIQIPQAVLEGLQTDEY